MTMERCRAAVLAHVVTFGFSVFMATAQPTEQSTDSSCTQRNSLSKRVQFADLKAAAHILRHRDPWAKQLSSFDLGARQKTAVPTSLHEFLTFAAASAVTWTPREEASWQPIIEKLGAAIAGLNLHVPNIDLVKTNGREEFGASYTRDDAIVLPESMISLASSNPRNAYFLLAHELFHVLSRTDSRLRDRLYALLGFERVRRFEYPAELEDRRISNPDAFEYLHTLKVQAGAVSVHVLPVIQSLVPLQEAIQLPNFFAALDIVLLPVEPRTGVVRRDSNGNLIRYSFGNTNWVPLMLRNSSYIIHPEELLADNFATLMEWRSTGVLPPSNPGGFPVNDVSLLKSIQDVLTGGCRQRNPSSHWHPNSIVRAPADDERKG
ncbi:MAG: hypothetical protein ACKV22_38955 [Bryobacteraceae bacterium]